MKQIRFYLDFVSPYAWLAFERLPEVLAGLNPNLSYHPAVAGGLFPPPPPHPGPGGHRTQARLDLPPCGLAGPCAGHAAATACAPPVQPAALAAPGPGL